MDPIVNLEYHFGITVAEQRSPIELPNVGRDWFATFLGRLELLRGVEVGVERGLYSEVLLKANPLLQLTCVDGWKAYRGYRDHVDQLKLDRFYVEAQERLAPYPRTRFIRKFSLEAVGDFKDGSLDFVYLDGNHSIEHVIADLAAWTPKVRPGGIIAGHDYSKYRLPNQIQVVQAINAWTDAKEIKPWFLLGTQAKVEGEVRDNARSFFWVHDPPRFDKKGKAIRQ